MKIIQQDKKVYVNMTECPSCENGSYWEVPKIPKYPEQKCKCGKRVKADKESWLCFPHGKVGTGGNYYPVTIEGKICTEKIEEGEREYLDCQFENGKSKFPDSEEE